MLQKTKEIDAEKKPFVYELGDLGKMKTDDELKVEIKVTSVDTIDERGKKAKAVLLSDGNVAIIKKGNGLVAEQAFKNANADQGRYMSLMIAACTTINGNHLIVEDLREDYGIADYQLLRNAFAEINF